MPLPTTTSTMTSVLSVITPLLFLRYRLHSLRASRRQDQLIKMTHSPAIIDSSSYESFSYHGAVMPSPCCHPALPSTESAMHVAGGEARIFGSFDCCKYSVSKFTQAYSLHLELCKLPDTNIQAIGSRFAKCLLFIIHSVVDPPSFTRSASNSGPQTRPSSPNPPRLRRSALFPGRVTCVNHVTGTAGAGGVR